MLSVVIPAYNEAPTIGRLLVEVAGALPTVSKQIVIVDDCSSDGTSEWLRRNLVHARSVAFCLTHLRGRAYPFGGGPANLGRVFGYGAFSRTQQG
jgi:glycosyltransferase involved in cell wall biosynthesis